MSNGNGKEGSFMDFARLAGKNIRRMRMTKEETPVPDEQASFERYLAPWATDERCTTGFMPWLEGEIAKAEADKVAVISDHPRLAYAMGTEDTLKRLRDFFKAWAGQSD